MPTKPFQQLLYRELRKVEAKPIIDIASPLLQEEVNYATNAFQRFQDSNLAKNMAHDEPLPTLMAYHHIINLADGIEVLVSQSCTIPSIPLLRSMFEALLTIEYILKDDCKNRAFAWLVCNMHTRVKQYDLLSPSNPKGNQFLEALSHDGLIKHTETFPPFEIDKVRRNLQSIFSTPNYAIAEIEYQKIIRVKKNRINWFSLFGGPNNLRDLAIQLNHWSEYDFLYRDWSGATHVVTLSHFLTKTNKKSPAFKVIRNHEELAQLTLFASFFVIDATKAMINYYRPGESDSFNKWYLKEIKKRHDTL
jgi:hypothetical protein